MSLRRNVAIVCMVVLSVTLKVEAQTGEGWRVAVIDSGIHKDDEAGKTRISREACYSMTDIVTHNVYIAGNTEVWEPFNLNTPLIPGADHYLRASTCPNGNFSSTASGISIIPRQVGHAQGPGDPEGIGPNPPPIRPYTPTYYHFGTKHGSNVVNALRRRAARSNIAMINVTHFEGEDSNTGACGFHSNPDENDDCYTVANGNLRKAIVHINNSVHIGTAAVNISLSNADQALCSSQSLKAEFDRLEFKDIPVFASIGNDFSYTGVAPNNVVRPVNWPACLPGVIAVGAVNSAGAVELYNRSDGEVDFWETGTVTNYNFVGTSFGTSYAAPRVAAAFTRIKSAVPSATKDQILEVMRDTGALVTDTRQGSGATGIWITPASINTAISVLQGDPSITPVFHSSSGDFSGEQFGTTFGEGNYPYGVVLTFPEITLNSGNTPSPPTPPPGYIIGSPSITGYRLRFRSRDLSSGELRVYINGTFYQLVAAGSNRLNTYSIFGTAFQNLFNSGTNAIEFRHSGFFFASDWGIEDIEITPIVEYELIEAPETPIIAPLIPLLLDD